MKVNNSISFGQTFVEPSIGNLSKINQSKVAHSYGLGQIYPVDIVLGGRACGDLTMLVKRSNLWDYFVLNDQIPVTDKNMFYYAVAKKLDDFGVFLQKTKYPVKKYIIKNLDNKSAKDIASEINNKIIEYNKNYAKKFQN